MYSSLVLGGTFDHFHAGHEALLSHAFSLGKHIILGLTETEMSTSKVYGDRILPYEERKREVERFALSKGRIEDLEIVPIHDVFGTTLEDNRLEAIVVTPHTVHGAKLINEARVEKGLKELEVHTCELVTDESGVVLSSTRIRSGLVNRSGYVYSHLFTHTLVLTEEVKEEVRKPLGNTYLAFPDLSASTSTLICVGDMVTDTVIRAGLSLASAWTDGMSARQPFHLQASKKYTQIPLPFTNSPGSIDASLVKFMEEHMMGENLIYQLQGEEDLLTLPAILLSPLGSMVIYGNPFGQPGVTAVSVTEEKKEEIRGLLSFLLVK